MRNMMEYVISDGLPFEEVEARAMEALEQHGFVVLRTFSLRSVTREIPELAATGTGFTVLLLYHSGPRNQPAGLVTLHQRRQQTVIRPMVTHGSLEAKSPRTEGGGKAELALQPENASLRRIVSALIAGGLEIRVDTPGGAAAPSSAQPEPMAEVVDEGLPVAAPSAPGSAPIQVLPTEMRGAHRFEGQPYRAEK